MAHRASLGTLFLVLLAACGADAPASVGRAQQGIINGTDSTAAQDAVVQIRVDGGDPNAPAGGVCTGALIAPNLVLTARHCVANGTEAGFECSQDGVAPSELENSRPGSGYAANQFKVFIGPNNPADDATPRAIGKKVIHDNAETLCNHDLALILLDQSITEAPTLKVRLSGPVAVGEALTSVGWGVTNTESPTPAVRKQRTGVAVTRVGPGDKLPKDEFEVGESICSGDSGGPAIAESTGEIVGVVSRGGNDAPDDPNDIAKGCVNGTNNYAAVLGFKSLIEAAIAEAGGGPATPDVGTSSSSSGAAAADPADDGGCATSPRRTSPGSALFVGLGLAALSRAWRRRR